MRLLVLALVLGVALFGATAPSAAAPLDPKLKSAARQLGAEGLVLYRRGDYPEALDRFERAYEILAAPTLGVHSARCMVKLGRLVEAAERYLEVTRYQLQPGDQWVYRQSQQEAQRERDKLLPRIPKLEIAVEGPRGDGIEVALDDRPMPTALVGAAQPVDPGRHHVVVKRKDVSIDDEAEVAEGGSARLVIRLPPLPPPKPEPAAADADPGGDWRPWTWVAFGIGAGGGIASVINGAVALSQQDTLEARCPNRVCPPEAHGAADVYDATRYATTVGLVIGIAGGLAGGALLLFAGGSDESAPASAPDTTDTELEAGMGRLTLRRRF